MFGFTRKRKKRHELQPPALEGDGNEPAPLEGVQPPESVPERLPELASLPRELLWLADAPMFIDHDQVEAFYDAILRPDYEGASLTFSDEVTKGRKAIGNLTVGAAVPGLITGQAQLGGEASRDRTAGKQMSLTVVSNAYRHLFALAIHYLTAKANRVVIRPDDGPAYTYVLEQPEGAEEGAEKAWMKQDFDGFAWADDAFIRPSPRALMFLELPRKTKLIPAALELEDGSTAPLYDAFGDKLALASGDKKPEYPGAGPEHAEARQRYWQWFADNYRDRAALHTVEKAVKDQKVAWIAFRVPLTEKDGPFLHLHIAGRGEYDTGVFGYNLISRGFKHGLRLVGTLKSEPDMNVLGIFER